MPSRLKGIQLYLIAISLILSLMVIFLWNRYDALNQSVIQKNKPVEFTQKENNKGGGNLFSRLGLPDRSPHNLITKTVGIDQVTISYYSPIKDNNDESVFGLHKRVPYDSIWVMGDFQATTINITSDFNIGSNSIGKGTYSLFAIPHEKEWTIILSRKLIGTSRYLGEDIKNDVMRFQCIPTIEKERVKNLTYSIDDVYQNSPSSNILNPFECQIQMSWDNVKIFFNLSFERKSKSKAMLDSVQRMLSKSNDWALYLEASEYCLRYANGPDDAILLKTGLNWINNSLSLFHKDTTQSKDANALSEIYFSKAELLAKDSKIDSAILIIEKAITEIESDKSPKSRNNTKIQYLKTTIDNFKKFKK